ncbi:GTP pyrophosphokinase [Streptococcus sp. DD10]|uniref:GTP pyrophosphokinase n=1 Tax=Streptococcus sp. DD10 TaxID=1777878 RepID=UPI00079A1201|nr:GTP pyrophosphokinase [Streptococcus sp. DD10]KXT74419.1 GTP pyrophosphokinase [Streptococcus sp. DD10]
MTSIYGNYESYLPLILEKFSQDIHKEAKKQKEKTSFKLYEHFHARIKTAESMIDKCQRKGYPITTESALKKVRDAIGVRIITGFVDDIYQLVEFIRSLPKVSIYNEKDFIRKVKPNGYRSYHMIVEVETPYPDCLGNENGTYFIEVQLRTIAMDSWASLEHQMKYKHDIKNPERITQELKRCADELASCDLTMQTIRNLIQVANQEEDKT